MIYPSEQPGWGHVAYSAVLFAQALHCHGLTGLGRIKTRRGLFLVQREASPGEVWPRASEEDFITGERLWAKPELVSGLWGRKGLQESIKSSWSCWEDLPGRLRSYFVSPRSSLTAEEESLLEGGRQGDTLLDC